MGSSNKPTTTFFIGDDKYKWSDRDGVWTLEMLPHGEPGKAQLVATWTEDKGVAWTITPSNVHLRDVGLDEGGEYWIGEQRYRIGAGWREQVPIDADGNIMSQSVPRQLIEDFSTASQNAYDENIKRYWQALRGTDSEGQAADKGSLAYQGSYLGMMDGARAYGQQEVADLREQGRWGKIQGQQDLTSRGLTGTTILPTMRMGRDRETAGNVGRARDRHLAYKNNLAQQRLGFIERRTDTYPRLSDLSSMMTALGQYGGSSGLAYSGSLFGGQSS